MLLIDEVDKAGFEFPNDLRRAGGAGPARSKPFLVNGVSPTTLLPSQWKTTRAIIYFMCMMRGRNRSLGSSTISALVGVGWLLRCGVSAAADGDLDPSFGTLGKVTTSLATFSDAADVAIQGDGKIVVVGTLTSDTFGEPPAMVVARYSSAAVLDPDFNGVGYVTAQVPTFGGSGRALVIHRRGGYERAGDARFRRDVPRALRHGWYARHDLRRRWDGRIPTSHHKRRGRGADTDR